VHTCASVVLVASIVTKKLSNGDTAYLVRYRTSRGQQRSQQFKRKIDARKFANNVEADKNSGTFVDPKAGRITLTEFWEQWYPAASISLAPNTRDRDTRSFKNHIKPHFGSTALAKIEYLDICDWVAGLSEKLRPESVHKTHQTLSKTLQAAVRAGKIRFNPGAAVPLPKIVRGEKVVLDRAEIEKLADAIDPRYRLFVWIAAYTGLRESEMAGLTWGALDLVNGWLHVRQQVTEVGGHQEVTTTLKTKAAKRSVPIPGFLIEMLELEREGAPDEAFVVPNAEGGPLRVNAFRQRYFDKAVKQSGIRKITPHSLRRTCITRWVDQGATPVQTKTWGGHSSVASILDLYAQHEGDTAGIVRDRMDDYARG
jgi:integrase